MGISTKALIILSEQKLVFGDGFRIFVNVFSMWKVLLRVNFGVLVMDRKLSEEVTLGRALCRLPTVPVANSPSFVVP